MIPTKIRTSLASVATLVLGALLLGSASVGLGACATQGGGAESPPAEPPLTDAKIEEIIASLGADAHAECQKYVRTYCKQKGATVAACNRYAESIRGSANTEQGKIVCMAVNDAQQPQ